MLLHWFPTRLRHRSVVVSGVDFGIVLLVRFTLIRETNQGKRAGSIEIDAEGINHDVIRNLTQ